MEIWKDIPGYHGYYISNHGRIKSTLKKYPMILKQYMDKYGYLHVRLYANKKPKNLFVHRLVLLAFDGESELTVNHIDCNKTNNNLENLEYMNAIENSNLANEKPIKAKSLDGKNTMIFKSIKEAERYGFLSCCIHCQLRGKQSHHKNYTFEYVKKGA